MRIFLEVYKEKSMTKAGDNLFMSQPSISQAIKELEIHYNTILFNRVSKKLFPTQSGERMYEHTKSIMGEVNLLSETMSASNSTKKYRLKIGCSLTLSYTYFPNLLKLFLDQNRDHSVYSVVNNSHYIIDLVEKNKLDAALIVAPQVSSSKIESTFLRSDNLVFVCNKGYYMEHKENISVEDLKHHPIIMRESDSVIKEIIEQNCSDLNVVGEYSNSGAILNAIEANVGVSVVPKVIFDKTHSQFLSSFKINHDDFKLNYWLIKNKDHVVSEKINSFINFSLKYNSKLE